MTALVIALLSLVVGCVAYLIWKSSQPDRPPSKDIDPEQAMKTAVELHAIHRRFDVSWIKGQQRREADRMRREIAQAFRGEHD